MMKRGDLVVWEHSEMQRSSLPKGCLGVVLYVNNLCGVYWFGVDKFLMMRYKRLKKVSK